MSDKALTIFERRFEEWELVHPRRNLADFISTQTEKIVKAQLEAADKIVISQDRIRDELKWISEDIRKIQEILNWGFNEIIWQLELQTEVLRKILKVLQAPLTTQAKELKKRAEEAYRNGWIEDALEDFLESERKNRYDFTIHQSLGNIYLFHKKDPNNALEYYEKAVKYAKPYSPYHTGFAFLHIGLIKYLQADFQKAYEATSNAIELSPDFYEAHFQHAQYCANLGKYDEVIEHLLEAIKGNRYYCVKVWSEKDFNVMKTQLKTFFEGLRDAAKNKAKNELKKAKELVQDAESYGVPTTDNKFNSAKRKLEETENLLRRGSLFDCRDATYKALSAQKMATDSSIKFLFNQISEIEGKRKIVENLRSRRIEINETTPGSGITMLIGVGILFYFLFRLKQMGMSVEGLILLFLVLIWPSMGLPAVIIEMIFNFILRIKSLKYVPEIKQIESRLNMLKNNLSEALFTQNYLRLEKDEKNEDDADRLEKLFRKKYG